MVRLSCPRCWRQSSVVHPRPTRQLPESPSPLASRPLPWKRMRKATRLLPARPTPDEAISARRLDRAVRSADARGTREVSRMGTIGPVVDAACEAARGQGDRAAAGPRRTKRSPCGTIRRRPTARLSALFRSRAAGRPGRRLGCHVQPRTAAGSADHEPSPAISSIAESEIANLTAFNLFGFDWDMKPFAVSEYVDVLANQQGSHVSTRSCMRDDLVWSDGKPITAHDVEFSFKLIMSSAVPVPAVRTGTDELRWVEGLRRSHARVLPQSSRWPRTCGT